LVQLTFLSALSLFVSVHRFTVLLYAKFFFVQFWTYTMSEKSKPIVLYTITLKVANQLPSNWHTDLALNA